MLQILSQTVVTKKGGLLVRCQHASVCCACDMVFAIFLPFNHETANDIPALYYLSGLTCTDQNFSQKAGPVAFPVAESYGMALVLPDTSPRGDVVPDDPSYDLGQGASFYINATQEPWAAHYQMETYVTTELPAVIAEQWPAVGQTRKSCTGHSMGGHGALTLFFKSRLAAAAAAPTDKPSVTWSSVSALAPICHPTACRWGQKAFENYLGSVEAGKAHDATELLKLLSKSLLQAGNFEILIDQGTADKFGQQGQLLLPDLQAAAGKMELLTVRLWNGMDHSYYFIAACIADHIHFHAKHMKIPAAEATGGASGE